MNLSARLRAREQELGRPVRIGLAGAGQMGMGFVAQVRRIPGMETAAIADVLPGRPKQAFAQAGVDGVVEGDNLDTLAQAVADGRPVGLPDARMLADLPVDVVVDATGVPDVGAWLSYAALTGGKDVASLNAEADVTIGLLLSRVAHASRAGLRPLQGRRAGRGQGAVRLRHRHRLRGGLRRQGQEQPAAAPRHPRLGGRRGRGQAHEPQDAGQLRRRHQDDDRVRLDGQRHRPGAEPAGHARAGDDRSRAGRRVPPGGRRRGPGPSRGGRLRHRPGGPRRVRGRPQRPPDGDRGDGLPVDGPRALLRLLPAVPPGQP